MILQVASWQKQECNVDWGLLRVHPEALEWNCAGAHASLRPTPTRMFYHTSRSLLAQCKDLLGENTTNSRRCQAWCCLLLYAYMTGWETKIRHANYLLYLAVPNVYQPKYVLVIPGTSSDCCHNTHLEHPETHSLPDGRICVQYVTRPKVLRCLAHMYVPCTS